MSGSVAAYKVATLIRLLVKAGAVVQPIMTRSARRFLGPATLAGLTGRSVAVDMFTGGGEPHVALAQGSDLIAVVPATADLLARLATARADDLVTATVLCARCPVLIAPAMHPAMWEHPLTQANVERLSRVPSWQLVGPAYGAVASGEAGWGRMVEPDEIVRAVAAAADRRREGAGGELAGRHLIVTAGPTLEDIDPVRALTNRSSGKMGFAIARAAAVRGARVTLITGPVALETPSGVDRVDVRSALDMQAALSRRLGVGLADADALIMCAAVADYRPNQASENKLKRSTSNLTLELVPNPDLLLEIARTRSGSRPFLMGFAVETEAGPALVAAARQKLAAKRVDAIVANSARDALGRDDTRAVLVTETEEQSLGPAPKARVSEEIIDFITVKLRGG